MRGGATGDEGRVLAQRTRRREALERSLTGRFWLRFHATLIVAGTFGTGFLASFVLLRAGLDAVLPRWLLAVACGYGAFFLLVRFWLAYVGIRRLAIGSDGSGGSSSSSGSSVDVGLPDAPWKGAGGRFGGAGATSDFASARPVTLADLGSESAPSSGTSLGTGSGGSGLATRGGSGGSGGRSSFDIGLDADDALPLILGLIVLALVAVVLGSAIAFIWTAPDVLSDAGFAALLAGGALPGLARAGSGDWHGTLFAATWKPLAAVVIVVTLAALALGHWFPKARTLGEAWRMLG
jgi:hypothetical protein